MHVPQNSIFVLLPLLCLFINSAVGSALPHAPHSLSTRSPSQALSLPTKKFPDLSIRRGNVAQPRNKRGSGGLANLGQRISGLPKGWSGVFTSFKSTRPSIPIASVFIRFFKQAALSASQDPPRGRYTQRFTYSVLVLEIVGEEIDQLVTRKFVEAAALWLMDLAQKGWIGLFVAWVTDDDDGETFCLRLRTIWDGEPRKISNSPWD